MKEQELKNLLKWLKDDGLLIVNSEDCGEIELPEIEDDYILECFDDGDIDGVVKE